MAEEELLYSEEYEEEERNTERIAKEVRANIKRIFQITESEGENIGISVDRDHLSFEQQKHYGVSYSDRCYSVFVNDKTHQTKVWGYVKIVYENSKRIVSVISVVENKGLDDTVARELLVMSTDIFFRSDSEMGFALKIRNDGPDSYYCEIPKVEHHGHYSRWVNWCD